MGKIYQKPRLEVIKIDQEIVMMVPSHPPGGWEPGDGKPPWVGDTDHPDHPSNRPRPSMFQDPLEGNSPFGNKSPF